MAEHDDYLALCRRFNEKPVKQKGSSRFAGYESKQARKFRTHFERLRARARTEDAAKVQAEGARLAEFGQAVLGPPQTQQMTREPEKQEKKPYPGDVPPPHLTKRLIEMD